MAITDSSTEGKSSDDLKEMLEQTGDEVVSEEGAETVETEEETGEEAKPEEPPEEEQPQEAKPKEKAEELYKLKVEGKEEELPLQKVLEYAQKGRYLEREIARVKKEREELRKGRETPGGVTPFGNIPPEKFDEWLVKELNDRPGATLFNLMNMAIQGDRDTQKREKTEDRDFEIEKQDETGDLWKELKPLYREFKDMGYSRNEAMAKAEADFWKATAWKTNQLALQKGEKKARDKMKAEMPSGGKRTGKPASASEMPSDQELKGMKAGDILKLMKKKGAFREHQDY